MARVQVIPTPLLLRNSDRYVNWSASRLLGGFFTPVQSTATRKRIRLRTPLPLEEWGVLFWRAVAVFRTPSSVCSEVVVKPDYMHEYRNALHPGDLVWPWPADLFDSWPHCYARAEEGDVSENGK